MQPQRVSFDLLSYTHLCIKCLGGITNTKMDGYNQYFAFSGYDDDSCLDLEERIYDAE